MIGHPFEVNHENERYVDFLILKNSTIYKIVLQNSHNNGHSQENCVKLIYGEFVENPGIHSSQHYCDFSSKMTI